MRLARDVWVAVHTLAASSVAVAQERPIPLSGVIRDTAGRPVAYAWVNAPSVRASAATNVSGEFRLLFKRPGEYLIEARRIGYEPGQSLVRVTPDREPVVEIVLREISRRLDAITIRETAPNAVLARNGFYSRMLDARNGILDGEFVTPEELELRRPQKVTQILDGMRGVRLRYSTARGSAVAMPFSSRGGCAMTIYLDGARFQTTAFDAMNGGGRGQLSGLRPGGGQVSGGRVAGPEGGLDGAISASHITAVEVYPSGTFAPAQFQLLNGTCGIIALWTKSGH